jgi:phosphonate transport system permease protein
MAELAAGAEPARGRLSPRRVTALFVAVAVLSALLGDLDITTRDPWREMARLALGLVTPDFLATERLGSALLQTLAFALLGVALGSVAGFGLAFFFEMRAVRAWCSVVRSIHELFWALIFLQMFGLTPLTGILAVALPYAGIFAKVYAEILEEADHGALQAVPTAASRASVLFFARLPEAWPAIRTYTLYRLECGIRSSAVLGFVGLPTLGFHLQSAFQQGLYSQVSALLFLFYALIATIRWWFRPTFLPLYLLAALLVLPSGGAISLMHAWEFLTSDIVPYPLRAAESVDAGTLRALGEWAWNLVAHQAWPGLVGTVLLTQIALVVAGVVALIAFPLVSERFLGRKGRGAGHIVLVVMRSTPEYILAYVLLQLWGPSMLPAVVALALHNGAIIGHLVGHQTNTLRLRPDTPRGVNLYAYELLPRVYGQFLAFLFYRWEIIFRETAILGILGVRTLGFYIDSAFADIRFDRALFLILFTAVVNMIIDALSRAIRARLRLTTVPHSG